MPGGKWVGKELDRSIAAAIAANKPREQIFAESLATYGCSRQTIHRSLHRVTSRASSSQPSSSSKPAASSTKPVTKPAARAPAGRDRSIREAVAAAITKIGLVIYDLAQREGSHLEEFIISLVRNSDGLPNAAEVPRVRASRRVEQLEPEIAESRREPTRQTPAPSAAEKYSSDGSRDLRSITTSSTPRRELDDRPGMVLDDPDEVRRSPRSGKPPQLGMRAPGRVGDVPRGAPPQRIKRSADEEDLEVARNIPMLAGISNGKPYGELATAIAAAEANKRPGQLPGDYSVSVLPSFASASEGERSLLRERVRRKRRKAAKPATA